MVSTKSIAFLSSILMLVVAFPATIFAQTPSTISPEWFENSKEAMSYYQHKIDGSHTDDRADFIKLFSEDPDSFLAPFRIDAPLCEETILADWQRKLKGKSLESFLYFLRSEEKIDDLVLRVLLNVYSAYAENGVFPENLHIEPASVISDPATLQKIVSPETMNESDQVFLNIHFDPCVSKYFRLFSPKMSDRKIQREQLKLYRERLSKTLARIPEIGENQKKIEASFDLFMRGRHPFGDEALSLDIIRRVATKKFFEFGKDFSPGAAFKAFRDQYTISVPPLKSAYLISDSGVNGFSHRQWLYELAARHKVKILAPQSSKWEEIFKFIGNRYSLSLDFTNLETSTIDKVIPLDDPEKFYAQFAMYLNKIETDLLSNGNQMKFAQMVAAGIEAGNMGDRGAVALWKIINKAKGLDPEQDKKDRRKKLFTRIGSAALIVVPPPFNFYGTFVITVIQLLGSQKGAGI